MRIKIEKKVSIPEKRDWDLSDYTIVYDLLDYLVRVIDSFEPKQKYILGLYYFLTNKGYLTESQIYLFDDLLRYYEHKGYFDCLEDN